MAGNSTKGGILNGERLAECRKKKGLKQKELADAVHVTLQHISNVERGKKNMSVELARNLSKVLGVREEYLLGEDDAETDADLEEDLMDYSDATRCVASSLNWSGFRFEPFEHSKRKIIGSGVTVSVPDRYLIQWESPTFTVVEAGDYVCSAKDFNYFTDALAELLQTQIELFLCQRCHPMTESERSEKEELDMQALADRYNVPRSTISKGPDGQPLINGKSPLKKIDLLELAQRLHEIRMRENK